MVYVAVEPWHKLRKARRLMNISQEETDALAGVTEGRTWSYEAGRVKRIPRDYWQALAREWFGDAARWHWFENGRDDDPPLPGKPDVPSAQSVRLEVLASVPCAASDFPKLLAHESAYGAVPDGAFFVTISDNSLTPTLMQSDLLLVVPTSGPRDNILSLVRVGGRLDIYSTRAYRGVYHPKAVSEAQAEPEPGSDYDLIGIVTRVARTGAGGLIIRFESETGLAPEMLTVI